MTTTPDSGESETVLELWRASEVFVYKVPPLTSTTGGYKAADWNLEAPAVTGSLKLLSRGSTVRVEIFDLKGNKVASCPITLDEDETKPSANLEWWVETVKDSSRYFVVRAVDPATKRQALLGVGFRERNAAFEFQSALDDHFKRVIRLRKAAAAGGSSSGAGAEGDSAGDGADEASGAGAADSGKFQLNGKITLKLGPKRGKQSDAGGAEQQAGGGGGGLGLAPPPSSSSSSPSVLAPPPATSAAPAAAPAGGAAGGAGAGGDVEWGDFQ